MTRGPAALCFLVLGLAPQAGAQSAPTDANPWFSPQIASFDYGVYCDALPDDVAEAPGTVSGVVNLVPIPEIRFRQLLVPAALGIAFGVLLQTQEGVTLDPVIVTVTHPPYPDSGITVEQWITGFTSEDPGLVGFGFEVETELLPGPWTFTADHGDNRIFEITFEVVSGDLLPEITGLCSGNLLF